MKGIYLKSHIQKANQSFDKLEGIQKEKIKYFLFQQKIIAIDVKCEITPPHL